MSLMGIDIGTSCCKASVFRADGEMIHCARRRYELQRDNTGGVALPSEEVWRKICEVIAEAAAAAGKDSIRALCAALNNLLLLRETSFNTGKACASDDRPED